MLKNFRYIFSTGPVLDSLTFAGSVILAETGKTDSTLIVMLHTKPEDSAVVNEKPRYVAKLDNKGRFIFRNLPPRTYYVYALKDDNRSLRYLDDKQLFAFGSSPVVVSDSTAPVTLYAYSVKPVQTQTSPTANLNIGAGTKGRGNNPAVDKRLKFTTNLMSGQQDLLSPFIMTFEQPLRFFDSTRMKLYKDSTFTAITAYSITLDSTKTQLQLVTSWQENSPYQLVFDKDFAEDSIGRKLLRTDTMRFATKRIADYGQLKVRVRNIDLTKNPVLQFVLNGVVTQSIPMTSAEINRNVFLPGDYELRILYDDNKNGKWDPGIFFGKRQQPELVKPIERRIVVRANWGNEFEIAL